MLILSSRLLRSCFFNAPILSIPNPRPQTREGCHIACAGSSPGGPRPAIPALLGSRVRFDRLRQAGLVSVRREGRSLPGRRSTRPARARITVTGPAKTRRAWRAPNHAVRRRPPRRRPPIPPAAVCKSSTGVTSRSRNRGSDQRIAVVAGSMDQAARAPGDPAAFRFVDQPTAYSSDLNVRWRTPSGASAIFRIAPHVCL